MCEYVFWPSSQLRETCYSSFFYVLLLSSLTEKLWLQLYIKFNLFFHDVTGIVALLPGRGKQFGGVCYSHCYYGSNIICHVQMYVPQ